jgi:tRNA-dihydrouridine synthase B
MTYQDDTLTVGPLGFPVSYRVRDIEIAPNVVLAPMEGVTDLVFRRLLRSIGGTGLTYTEFIASKGLVGGSHRENLTASFDPDERPIALQIYGRQPALMAEAARILEDRGATILDINMGCPSKKVCQNSGGSALMREPDMALEIVRAVRAAIKIPLTVKMRSGFDASCRNAPELAWRCQEEGAEAITIHWRTREDRYGGQRAVDKIAEAVQRLRVPVIANGDIIDIPSARAMLEDTGCAGLMVGRGAIRNPWLPSQLSAWLRGQPVPEVDAAQRRDVLLRYFDTIQEAFRHPGNSLGRMKMVTKHFTEDLPCGDGLRTLILTSQDVPAVYDHVRRYFDLLHQLEQGHPGPMDASDYANAAIAQAARKEARRLRKLRKAS